MVKYLNVLISQSPIVTGIGNPSSLVILKPDLRISPGTLDPTAWMP